MYAKETAARAALSGLTMSPDLVERVRRFQYPDEYGSQPGGVEERTEWEYLTSNQKALLFDVVGMVLCEALRWRPIGSAPKDRAILLRGPSLSDIDDDAPLNIGAGGWDPGRGCWTLFQNGRAANYPIRADGWFPMLEGDGCPRDLR